MEGKRYWRELEDMRDAKYRKQKAQEVEGMEVKDLGGRRYGR